jgi:VanZ family protein
MKSYVIESKGKRFISDAPELKDATTLIAIDEYPYQTLNEIGEVQFNEEQMKKDVIKHTNSLKKLGYVIVTILVFLFNAQSQHFQDTWEFRTDKKFHAFAGFTVSSIFASACYYNTLDFKEAMVWGVATGGGVNLLKELFDLTTGLGTASIQDLTYGVGGAVVGSLFGIGVGHITRKAEDKRKEKERLKVEEAL